MKRKNFAFIRLPIHFFVVLPVLACLFLASCGYKLASEEPSVLGNGEKTLKVKRIENPTLYPWLSYQMRTVLHDEINYRQLAKWVDSGEADYEIEIVVKRFNLQDHGYVSTGSSVMYSASMTMQMRLYDGSTNKQVWNSGDISYSRVYDTDNAQAATEELSRELIFRCLDRMRFVF